MRERLVVIDDQISPALVQELCGKKIETWRIEDGACVPDRSPIHTRSHGTVCAALAGEFLPELELVAEEDGRLAGHIMLTGQPVPGSPEGFRGLLVAPLCVRLEDRSRGLGGRLLQAAGDLARERGYHALFLVGDPDYYGRYGFAPAVSRGFQNTTGVPDRFVQVLELRPGALDGAGGELDLH